jgi:hypothetical protein
MNKKALKLEIIDPSLGSILMLDLSSNISSRLWERLASILGHSAKLDMRLSIVENLRSNLLLSFSSSIKEKRGHQ